MVSQKEEEKEKKEEKKRGSSKTKLRAQCKLILPEE